MIDKLIRPMLCDPIDKPFRDQGWIVELKWDGERCIMKWNQGKISLQNRALKDVTRLYPELQPLRFVDHRNLVLDGELIVNDSKGRPSFNLLAQRAHLANDFSIRLKAQALPVCFMAFDILWLDDKPLVGLPLEDRKDLLHSLGGYPPLFMFSLNMSKDGDGIAVFNQVKANDLEGIVMKRLGSKYIEGVRSAAWRKIKAKKSKEIEVVKYSINPGGIRVTDRSEMVAVQVAKDWKLVKQLMDLHGKCLIEVEYMSEEAGKLRQPVYKGVRT